MCAGPLPRRSIPTSLNKKTMECCGTKDIQPYNHVILEKIKVIKLISSPKKSQYHASGRSITELRKVIFKVQESYVIIIEDGQINTIIISYNHTIIRFKSFNKTQNKNSTI